MALKKPSNFFTKQEIAGVFDRPVVSSHVVESYDKFLNNFERVNELSEKVEVISKHLNEKLNKNDLETAMLSQLMILDENFKIINEKVQGINKKDLKEFKSTVYQFSELINNLIDDELPKYKKQVTRSELKLEEKLEKFNQTFDTNFSELESQLAEKIEFCIQKIDNIFASLNYDEKISEQTTKIGELQETSEKLSSNIEIVERYITNHHEDVINLREEVFRKFDLLPIEDLAERINQIAESYNKISEEITLAEGLLNEPPETKNDDPLTPLDQNFVTLDQLNAHYKLFLARIQQQLSTIGGGGETQLKYLDDIVGIATNASAYDGKYLKYNHSLGKFEFTSVDISVDNWVDSATGVYTQTNVGIGSTLPQVSLDVVGDVKVTGIVTAFDFDTLSDISYKDNVVTIDNPLDKISQLRGVSFNWKEDNRPSLGVIAQEVQIVLPQLVHGPEQGVKTVNYNGLIGLLIECVKMQQEEIEELKKRLP